MAESDLIRWGGLAAIGGGILLVLYSLLALALGRGIEEIGALDILFLLGYVLILVGLLGFHTLQGRNYGRIGRAGLYTSIGSFLVLFLFVVASLLAGTMVLVVLDAVVVLGLLVGLTLYGAATLQARVLPRWCGILFIILVPGAILLSSLLGWQLGPLWNGLVWLALGYGLWSHRSATAEQPPRVR